MDFVLTFFQDVVKKIEKTPTSGSDKPVKDVVIADSGTLPVDKPFEVSKEEVTV